MGYISAQTATTLTIELTEEGRNRISQGGNFINLFDKFAISDGDIDYRNTQLHADTTSTSNDSAQLGYLTDVTGIKNTYKSEVNSGYKQRNIVWMTPEGKTQLKLNRSYVAVGVRQPNNSLKYYRNNLVIDCYLHDYFVLTKLLAARYVGDHKDILSSDPTNILTNTNSYFGATLGLESNEDYSQFLNKLSEYGVSQYLDIWETTKVYDGAEFNTHNIKLVPQKDYSYYNALALAGGAFMSRGEENGVNFKGTNITGVNIASPFSLLFSPGIDEKASKYKLGAGASSIGFAAFSMGYINAGGANPWNTKGGAYPVFNMNNTLNGWSTSVDDIKNIFVGFVTAVDMETMVGLDNSQLGNAGYNNISTTIPSCRMVLNIADNLSISPLYYPIKLPRLTDVGNRYVPVNGNGALGLEITDTAHPSDTFGLLLGNLEYSSNWVRNQQGFKSSAPYLSIYPSSDAGIAIESSQVLAQQKPYYTLATRSYKMADDIFVSIAGQNSMYWETNTYSGGFKAGLSGDSVSGYNISIPVTWKAYSTESPNSIPCNITVNFVFNKDAVMESLVYTRVGSENYYRMFDNATFKFYGEDGATLASHSTDPRGYSYLTGAATTWQTSDGKNLFRKVITGQEI